MEKEEELMLAKTLNALVDTNEKIKLIKTLNALIEYLEVQNYDIEYNRKKIIFLEKEIKNMKKELQLLGGML